MAEWMQHAVVLGVVGLAVVWLGAHCLGRKKSGCATGCGGCGNAAERPAGKTGGEVFVPVGVLASRAKAARGGDRYR